MMRPVFLLALAAGACSATNDAGPAAKIDPAGLYAQNCARCHGADGRPDPAIKQAMPTIRDFTDPQFKAVSNEQIAQVIMMGRNQMPPFGGQLSPPKIQAVTGHVRRLAGAAGK